MTMIIDGSSGATFPDSSVQAVAGKVIQVVQGSYGTSVGTNSTSFVTSNLTASITPKFSTSKILVLVSGQTYSSGANVGVPVSIYRGGSSIHTNAGSYNTAGGASNWVCLNYLDSPATTSSTTYTVYFRTETSATTVYFNSGSLNTTITLLEIAA